MAPNRTTGLRAFAGLCLLGLFFVLPLAAAIESDQLLAQLKPDGYVNDYAGVFDTAQKNTLEQELRNVARGDGPEIVVVALKSLEGGEINDFANKLFARWKIGKKDKDNGVLLIAAIQDRVMRIEVGYGLEGVLTDAGAGRIRDQVILPRFKAQQYAEGLTEGAQAIVAVVTGKPGAVGAAENDTPEAPWWFIVLFWGVIILLAIRYPKLFLFLTLFGGRGGRGGGGGFGGFGGGRSGGGGASGRW